MPRVYMIFLNKYKNSQQRCIQQILTSRLNIHGSDRTVKKGSVLHPASLATVLLRQTWSLKFFYPHSCARSAWHGFPGIKLSTCSFVSLEYVPWHLPNKLPCVGSQGPSAGYGDIHTVLKLILLCLCSIKEDIGASLFYLELNCCAWLVSLTLTYNGQRSDVNCWWRAWWWSLLSPKKLGFSSETDNQFTVFCLTT